MHAVIYHNPRCSKSRATLALLQQHGVQVETVDYLAQPPSTNTLRALLAALDLPVTAMVRFTEARAAQLDCAGMIRELKRSGCSCCTPTPSSSNDRSWWSGRVR